MNRTEHLLVILAEECNEVAHRVSKALRFGLGEIQEGQSLTNADRIRKEFADLIAVWKMLEAEGAVPQTHTASDFQALVLDKTIKVQRFLHYSDSLGLMDGPIHRLINNKFSLFGCSHCGMLLKGEPHKRGCCLAGVPIYTAHNHP